MKTSDNFKVVQSRVTRSSKFFEVFVPCEFLCNMNFQPASKKPKLDVILSSSSGSSSCRNSPASDTKGKQSLLDELWGDDWSEDVIESYVQLETQICSQLPTTQRASVELTQNVATTSGKAGKQQNTKELPVDYTNRFVTNTQNRSSFQVPLRRTASGGDWSKAVCNGSQYSNIQAVSLALENNNKIKVSERDSNALSNKFESLSLEYKKLQERYQAKEGETSLLRTHLISTQNEIEKQKKEKAKEIESIKHSMQASINDLTKEIDSLKTQLHFKSMEVEAITTKNQQVHIGNRVQPESPVPRHKVFSNCFDRSQFIIPETKSEHQDKKNVYNNNSCKLLDLSHGKKWVSVHNCHLLHQLITPFIFYNSKLESNCLDPPRSVSKPSLLSDLNENSCDRNEMKSMPSPQPSTSKNFVALSVFKESRKDSCSPCKQFSSDRSGPTLSVRRIHKELHTACSTLEQCHLQLMKLTNMTDLDSEHALQLIEQVVLTCTKILWELQNRLVEADKQKNFIEREKELLLLGYTYTPLTEEYDILDNKPWYRNEQGVEARRSLGLMSALVQTAKHMAHIILPSFTSGTGLSSNKSGGMHDYEMDEENSNSKLKNLSPVTNRCDNDRPFKRFKLSNDHSSSDENGKQKPSNILNIIKNIIELIGKQRRTLMFEGVLAGVTVFITSLLQWETELSQDTQKVIAKILEQLVFSRPGPTVLLKVFHLLLAAVKCSTITKSLCHHSADKTCLEGYTHVTFTPDTCTMQVLCLLVRLVPTEHRFLITDVYTAWLLSIFIADRDGPSWLYSDPSKATCQCRPNVSQLALILLGEACNVYNSKGGEEYKDVLERILQRGIFLIHKLLYKDEHFVVNAGDCEGYYELFLHAVSTFEPPIPLHQASKEVLENLCQQEAVRQPLHVVDVQNEEVQSVLSSLYDTPNEGFMEND